MSNGTLYVDEVIPRWYVGLICLFLYPIGFIAICANICVLIATVRSRKLRDNTGIIIASMAVNDLVSGVFLFEFTITMWMVDHSVLYCQIQNAISYCFVAMSVMHVIFMNIDRYVYIMHPFLYQRYNTRLRTLACVASIWLLPVTSLLIHRIPGHRSVSCMYAAHTLSIALISFSSVVIVPAILMAFLFYRLYGVVRRQSSAVQQQVTQAQSPSSPHVKRSQKKAIKLITMIMALFLCCWIPSQIVPTLFLAFDADIKLLLNYFYPWFFVFGFLNPALNPIVYVMYNPRYKQEVIHWLKPQRKVDNDTD